MIGLSRGDEVMLFVCVVARQVSIVAEFAQT
jgi:hypothetical protein